MAGIAERACGAAFARLVGLGHCVLRGSDIVAVGPATHVMLRPGSGDVPCCIVI